MPALDRLLQIRRERNAKALLRQLDVGRDALQERLEVATSHRRGEIQHQPEIFLGDVRLFQEALQLARRLRLSLSGPSWALRPLISPRNSSMRFRVRGEKQSISAWVSGPRSDCSTLRAGAAEAPCPASPLTPPSPGCCSRLGAALRTTSSSDSRLSAGVCVSPDAGDGLPLTSTVAGVSDGVASALAGAGVDAEFSVDSGRAVNQGTSSRCWDVCHVFGQHTTPGTHLGLLVLIAGHVLGERYRRPAGASLPQWVGPVNRCMPGAGVAGPDAGPGIGGGNDPPGRGFCGGF